VRAEAAAFFARFLAADLEMLGAVALGWEDIWLLVRVYSFELIESRVALLTSVRLDSI
jgi:hypothetical protein